ncbi:gamma-glutamyltransferase family protein [Marinobacter psychrophilus]|uniref:gamma-glutamyltransferase family protein n=1 Tax=Marinobacter psychrophilus TaxID=330734 RepID=UPI00222813ED|nr:gamma-glutamyltransferase family protein [Marinobacter psychrophilus]
MSTLTWPDLLEPAIALARDGYGVSANQAFWQQQRHELIQELPDLGAFCCNKQGNLLAVGTQGGDGQPETQMVLATQLIPFTGLADAIAVHPDGRREAMHDPRGDGTAQGQ